MSHPTQKGAARIAGIKIHDTRMIRLMEQLYRRVDSAVDKIVGLVRAA